MHLKDFAAQLISSLSATVFTLIGILYAKYASESAEQVTQWMQDMTNHW
jgi:zinc transporter ZupT